MTMIRIATTRNQDMQALRLAGQLVISAAASITAVLTRMLSPQHAALFAEPEADMARGEVDWYADVSVPVGLLFELAEPARSHAQATLQSLVAEISELAGRLAASADVNERRTGDLLKLALEIPGPFCIRIAGTQPILIGWGHHTTTTATALTPVLGEVRVPAPLAPAPALEIMPPPLASTGSIPPPIAPQSAPQIAPQITSTKIFWLIDWRLLAAALMIFIAALLLLRHDLWLLENCQQCQIADADQVQLEAWRQAEQQGTVLDATLTSLQNQAASALRHCAVPQPQSQSQPSDGP
jgi:hypothetical protein